MIYKRKEPFRFQFQQPIHGTFKVLSINGVKGDLKSAMLYIVDISPNGIRFKSNINLPIENNEFLLEISFLLVGRLIRMIGKPKWKKVLGNFCMYGFIGLDDNETKKEIIEVLKEYTKLSYKESQTDRKTT